MSIQHLLERAQVISGHRQDELRAARLVEAEHEAAREERAAYFMAHPGELGYRLAEINDLLPSPPGRPGRRIERIETPFAHQLRDAEVAENEKLLVTATWVVGDWSWKRSPLRDSRCWLHVHVVRQQPPFLVDDVMVEDILTGRAVVWVRITPEWLQNQQKRDEIVRLRAAALLKVRRKRLESYRLDDWDPLDD